jgi:hypothetical protein
LGFFITKVKKRMFFLASLENLKNLSITYPDLSRPIQHLSEPIQTYPEPIQGTYPQTLFNLSRTYPRYPKNLSSAGPYTCVQTYVTVIFCVAFFPCCFRFPRGRTRPILLRRCTLLRRCD